MNQDDVLHKHLSYQCGHLNSSTWFMKNVMFKKIYMK